MNQIIRNGLKISSRGLGTWTFAGDAAWGPSDRKDCIRIIHEAIDCGIRLFDTAPNYGNGQSELILGEALKDRHDIVVADKIKIDGLNAAHIKENIQKSLKRLNRDSIDLLQIHWPGPTPESTIEALATLEDLKRSGDIGQFGVCNFGVFDLNETSRYAIASNQLPYNLFWRVIEERIARASKARDLITIAYSPLQQGLLSGKYKSIAEYPEARKRTRHFNSGNSYTRHNEAGMEELVKEALAKLEDISKRTLLSFPDLSMGFINSRQFIDVVLFGARTVSQLRKTLKATETRLNEDLVSELEKITSPLKDAASGNPDMFQSESRVRFA